MTHLSTLICQQSVKASLSLVLACLPMTEGVSKPNPQNDGNIAHSKPDIEQLAPDMVQKPGYLKVAPPPDRGSGR